MMHFTSLFHLEISSSFFFTVFNLSEKVRVEFYLGTQSEWAENPLSMRSCCQPKAEPSPPPPNSRPRSGTRCGSSGCTAGSPRTSPPSRTPILIEGGSLSSLSIRGGALAVDVADPTICFCSVASSCHVGYFSSHFFNKTPFLATCSNLCAFWF